MNLHDRAGVVTGVPRTVIDIEHPRPSDQNAYGMADRLADRCESGRAQSATTAADAVEPPAVQPARGSRSSGE